ncbi:MAG: formate dehydrogenase accessory sulfurtransferase FdhD [Clostridia bacterium]|nr:formate dehydrogenase accessory sulfurtransferase FdhD [Clostridia bacterium]
MRVIDCSEAGRPDPFLRVTAEEPADVPAVAAEHRMDVFINERPAMRLVCTPEHLDELAVGRLLTEGIASDVSEIREVYICEQGLRARILVTDAAAARMEAVRAETVATCCTDNRTLVTGGLPLRAVEPLRWESSMLLELAARLRGEDQPVYQATRAVHACFLADKGGFLCGREDIGRHNALDKAVGWAAMAGVDLRRCAMFTTGRMPMDMVTKAIRCGVPLLASKTCPTDRGIALAREYGLTLVTVRPDGALWVWSDGAHPERSEET